MSKLSYEEKIDLYNDWKNGISVINLTKKYNINKSGVVYLTKLIDKHGYDIIRKNKNKNYSIYDKKRIINRVLLDGESIITVSIDEGLIGKGILNNWIKNYKDMGYNIVERKRGRSPTMPKKTINKDNETDKEKIKRLEEENLYLKAELEYSKKLRAVVQARKNQQQKKKWML